MWDSVCPLTPLADWHGTSNEGAFHLTPAGWLRVDDEPFPADRIETWRYSMHQASGWSREHRSLYCEWGDQAIAREERDTLRKKYGWPYGLTPSRDTVIYSLMPK